MDTNECKRLRDFLWNLFADEKKMTWKCLRKGNESRAQDVLHSDATLIDIVTRQKFTANKLSIPYHRELLGMPGQAKRFLQYKAEWETRNGDTTTAK